jgi:hypothetical protein
MKVVVKGKVSCWGRGHRKELLGWLLGTGVPKGLCCGRQLMVLQLVQTILWGEANVRDPRGSALHVTRGRHVASAPGPVQREGKDQGLGLPQGVRAPRSGVRATGEDIPIFAQS